MEKLFSLMVVQTLAMTLTRETESQRVTHPRVKAARPPALADDLLGVWAIASMVGTIAESRNDFQDVCRSCCDTGEEKPILNHLAYSYYPMGIGHDDDVGGGAESTPTATIVCA